MGGHATDSRGMLSVERDPRMTDEHERKGMRALRSILALAVVTLAAALTAAGISAAPVTYTLQILHFYGETGTIADETAPVLGTMAETFEAAFPTSTLTLAEGDTWIPGPWLVAGADPALNAVPGIGITALGRPDVAIMNAIGVDASALGNHEFDLGSPVVQTAITPQTTSTAAWPGAQFPFISSNLDVALDNSMRGLSDASLGGTATNAFAGKEASTIKAKLAPYAVVTVGGEKIGIVGSTTWELLTKTSPNGTKPKDDGNPATDDLEEVAAYLQASVDALTAAGVNKIVMVDQLDTIDRNRALAPLVRGIDVMVAGGGHERLGDANDVAVPFNGHTANFVDTYPITATDADGNPTLIVTTDTEFTYLGRLVVGFNASGVIEPTSLDTGVNGAYAANEATLQAVTGSSSPAATIVAASATGAKVKAISGAINTIVTTKDGNKFGFSSVYLEGDRFFGRAQEVNLGDITADANTEAARSALGLPADAPIFSLKNGGGLRASIGSIDEDGAKVANPATPTGNVSQLDVENALRFDNKLMVFDLTSQQLLNVLNYAAGLPAGNGGFPQVGGIRYSYDPSLPAGQKVRSVALYASDGRQLAVVAKDGVVVPGAPASIKTVALNFTANGGDGYPIKGVNGSGFRYLKTDGTVSAAIPDPVDPTTIDFTGASGFTAAGVTGADLLGEQKTFETYLRTKHGTPATAYAQADTPQAQDLRIQNLAVRADAVIAPTLTVPADLTVEATSPAGAVVEFAATAADAAGVAITPVCTPASGSVFPIGLQTVTCTATAPAGNATTGSFDVRVVGARDQIASLRSDVSGLPSLQSGRARITRAILLLQLDGASAALRSGRRVLACGAMALFAGTVNRSSPPITESERIVLTQDAARIRSVIGC